MFIDYERIMTMADEVRCKGDLTFDQLVYTMRTAWTGLRDAQLLAFYYAAPVLTWARENEADFVIYCRRHRIVGDTLETRVVELMLAEDGDSEAISRERRAEYGNCIGWFADHELCPETDPDKAVALARQKRRISGIAQEYRDKKDANNPKAKAAKLKGQATKARRQDPENNLSRAASAAAARVFAEQMDSQPTTISQTQESGHDFCAAAGDSDAMIAFMFHHGISAGLKPELDDDNHVQIYLRVRNRTEEKFELYGPALDPDFADNLADIIVREHNERAPKIAEVP
jgi:hypothetical protein